ncbi:DUF916 and DUF3324 domain-containing protein [Enterococcus innesii]|uniref:DUF916 and DUF3324 domain-containing protein n=1 Tax=Enterococcus innesii TaxID=2839759 RepID=UPI0022B956D3|nr:DUF916 and DUF3324 domain-containing protein [Enterococcus innesii]
MKGYNKKSRISKQVMGIAFLLFLFIGAPGMSGATTQSELPFHVVPNLPQSQLADGNSGYFDLEMAPGTSDLLGLTIQNHSTDDIVIEVSAHTAFTNGNGVVEYGKDATEPDPTLLHSLADLIDSPGEITLSANEKKTIELPIHMPEAAFPGQVNYRNAFRATLQNPQPRFLNQLEVVATVRRADQEEILYEAQREGMQMAPNSHFHFPVSLAGDRFYSGEYVMSLTARSEGEEWSWEYPFTVEADVAKHLNREDVTLDPEANWWLISTFGLVMVLLGTIIWLLWKNKKPRTDT